MGRSSDDDPGLCLSGLSEVWHSKGVWVEVDHRLDQAGWTPFWMFDLVVDDDNVISHGIDRHTANSAMESSLENYGNLDRIDPEGQSGISLPQRRPSVTLHSRVSLSEGDATSSPVIRRDSLEGTRQFVRCSSFP